MREQHLSDEAVAAFADGVLSGHARERARRHCAVCPGCNYAVAVQREAVWALRAAPAPCLPTGLMDRLREVPATTPISRIPTAVDDDGNAMFATFAAPAAALVPQAHRDRPGTRRGQSRTIAAVSVAAVAALAGVASIAAAAPSSAPARTHQGGVSRPASTTELPADTQLARALLPARPR